MKTANKAIQNYGHYRNLILEILDAERHNVSYRFDEFEVVESGDCNPDDYPYTDQDIDVARGWTEDALNEMISEVKALGLEIDLPYNDSIYIHNGNGKAITIRDHQIANSTWRHWDELFAYNFGQAVDFSNITN